MKLAFKSSPHLRFDAEATAIFVAKSGQPDSWWIQLRRLQGSGVDALLTSPEFGAEEDAVHILRFSRHSRRIVLIGLGPNPDHETFRRGAAKAVKLASSFGLSTIMCCVPDWAVTAEDGPPFSALVEGVALAAYRFDRYKSDRKAGQGPMHLCLVSRNAWTKNAKQKAREALTVCTAVNFARDLANAPSNIMTPSELARQTAAMCRRNNIRCRILQRQQLEAGRFGGILCVAKGSAEEPRFIIMEYRSSRPRLRKPIVLVGKGVTFDSGGISIKPAADMDRMKFDMSGGAFVIGVLQAVASLALPIHVIGLVPAAENLLGCRAYRPGDIIRMFSGHTVEILNTDAEGRLLLGDALAYARRLQPEAIMDLATLTGHCVVALGGQAAGLFTNSVGLRDRLMSASARTGERIWELPIFKEHEKAMKSHIADLKNSGGRPAGASTAAAFLQTFVGHVPWAHLDIAGTAYTDEEAAYTAKASSTGFGIRLLVETLATWKSIRS